MSFERLTTEQRSALMRKVRAKDTKPEMSVRRMAHHMGFRFRLHRRDLPGTPDLVFPRLHLALFVHGCFWHQHEGCRLASLPKSRQEYWLPKLRRNIARDETAREQLKALGWRVETIWECQCRSADRLKARLTGLLRGPDTA